MARSFKFLLGTSQIKILISVQVNLIIQFILWLWIPSQDNWKSHQLSNDSEYRLSATDKVTSFFMTVNTVSVQLTKSQASSWLWIPSQYSRRVMTLSWLWIPSQYNRGSMPSHDYEYLLSATGDPCLLMTMNTFSVLQQGIHAFSWLWKPSLCNRVSMPSHDNEYLVSATESPFLLMTMNTFSGFVSFHDCEYLLSATEGLYHFMIVNTFSVQQRVRAISWLWIPSQCNKGSEPLLDCEYRPSAADELLTFSQPLHWRALTGICRLHSLCHNLIIQQLVMKIMFNTTHESQQFYCIRLYLLPRSMWNTK